MNNLADGVKDYKALVFSFFGGADKIDCYLNRMAEVMAKPDLIKIATLPSFIPESYRGMMHRPEGVVDLILEKLELLGMWSFQIYQQNGRVTVVDLLNGHIVEEAKEYQVDLQALAKKYGVSDAAT
jgi:hypothetical protein